MIKTYYVQAVNKELRELVLRYMFDECDVDEHGPVTEKQIDKQIEVGIDFYGSKANLLKSMREWYGVKE